LTIGLASAALALAILATPALAKKEVVYFGHFTASIFGQELSPTNKAIAKGKGEVSEFRVGPIECGETTLHKLPTMTFKAEVESERSSELTAVIKFKGCYAALNFGKGGNFEEVKVSFGKGLKVEFHANGSASLGNPAGEVKILETAAIPVKVPGHKCKLFIPAQTLPVQAERKPEKEFEAIGYATEKEAVEEKELKKFPSGFKERLGITMELKKLVSYVPVEAGKCEYKKGTEGKYEPEGEGRPNRVEYNNGKFEGEFEELEIKKGEFGFDSTPEP